MKKYITFDMDGTIADFYNVENWLSKIRAHNPSPYAEAKPLCNMSKLARKLNKLQERGWKIRVVSWGSKDLDDNFLTLTRIAKKIWLAQHLPSVHFDEICVVHYGTPKIQVGKYRGGILFDDEGNNRINWKGEAYDETEIFEILNRLLKGDA